MPLHLIIVYATYVPDFSNDGLRNIQLTLWSIWQDLCLAH